MLFIDERWGSGVGQFDLSVGLVPPPLSPKIFSAPIVSISLKIHTRGRTSSSRELEGAVTQSGCLWGRSFTVWVVMYPGWVELIHAFNADTEQKQKVSVSIVVLTPPIP